MRTLKRWIAALCATFVLFALPLPAQNAVGAFVEARSTVHFFDPDSQQVTASVLIPGGNLTTRGILISPDLSEAYLADRATEAIYVIDLTASPPALADGINPIPVSNHPRDLALSPDGRFLVAGSSGPPVASVVDPDARVEVFTLPLTWPGAVETAPDGSVLVVSCVPPFCLESTVHRYTIDETGSLIDTGESISNEIPGVFNLLVPTYPHLPSFLNRFLSRHTLYAAGVQGLTAGSLRTDGMTEADEVTMTYPVGIDIVFDPLRSLAYIRSLDRANPGGPTSGDAQVDGYFFNPFTGGIGPRIVSIPLESQAGTAVGLDQMAIDPRSRKLFVSGTGLTGVVRVFDSLTGQDLGTVSGPAIGGPVLGIAVRRAGKKSFPWH